MAQPADRFPVPFQLDSVHSAMILRGGEALNQKVCGGSFPRKMGLLGHMLNGMLAPKNGLNATGIDNLLLVQEDLGVELFRADTRNFQVGDFMQQSGPSTFSIQSNSLMWVPNAGSHWKYRSHVHACSADGADGKLRYMKLPRETHHGKRTE